MSGIDPLAIMVGGTTMNAGAGGTYSETAWGDGPKSYYEDNHGTDGTAGSGGGYSMLDPRTLAQSQSPAVAANAAQYPLSSAGMRLGPDISMMSQPGIDVLQTYSPDDDDPNGYYEWDTDGGTSLSTPMFAGIMAIVAQGRALAGRPALGSTDTQTFLYQAPAADFHDITSGNNGYAATTGFDLASGLGTPTPALIQDLVAATYPTTTTVSSTARVAAGGPQVRMTAQVAPAFGARVATGSVVFTDNGTTLATVPLDASGQASYMESGSAVGTHSIQAKFLGSDFFAASDGWADPIAVATPTTTALVVSPGSLVIGGGPVTLAATVAASFGSTTPSGSVGFYDGTTLIGTATLDASGRASLVDSPAAIGSHSIRAVFLGSQYFATSASQTGQFAVSPATTTTLVPQVGDLIQGARSVTLAASVVTDPGAPQPTGSVAFYLNGQIVGSAPLDPQGHAAITLILL